METNYEIIYKGNGKFSYRTIVNFPIGMESYLDVIAEGFEPVGGDDYE